MKNKSNVLLFASVVLIILAVALVSILGKSNSGNTTNDVRARAGTQYTLKLLGTVTNVNEVKGTIDVTNVQFSDANRAGDAQNLGDWIVTTPQAFNFASISQGSAVTIGVDAATFKVTSHTVTALTITSP